MIKLSLSSTKLQDSYYKISQSFGERHETINDEDFLTALAFDRSGEHLAVGDQAGRLILFKFLPPSVPSMMDDHPVGSSHNLRYKRISSIDLGSLLLRNGAEYEYLFDFQSHVTEFDYLKSEVIDQKIENISFLNNNGNQLNLISSNSKTIKLWRVSEKHPKNIIPHNKFIFENKGYESSSKNNILSPCVLKFKNQKTPSYYNLRDINDFSDSINEIEIMNCIRSFHDDVLKDPCMTPAVEETVYLPKLVQEFYKLHKYAINSVNVFKNDTLMLSSDDLKIYLWHLNNPLTTFAVIDKTPFDLDEVNEVITCSELSNINDNLFVFGTSRGTINMCDLRIKATDCVSDIYKNRIKQNGSLEEVLASISHCNFNKEDNFIISRDYLTVKIWDVRMGKHVYKEIEVYEPIKSKMAKLYKKELIFDKFRLAINKNDTIVTGNYNDSFHIIDWKNDINSHYVLNENDETEIKINDMSPLTKKKDFIVNNRILRNEFHPQKDLFALCAENSLFIYNRFDKNECDI